MKMKDNISFNSWTNWNECPINEQGRKVVEHPTASNQKRTLGGSQMAENANSGILSQESNPDNWKSIGELARKLAEKAAGGDK